MTMHTITLSYSLFALFCVLFIVAVGGACTLFALVKTYRRDNATLSRTYSELLVGSGKRESELLKERNGWRLQAQEYEKERGQAIVLYKVSAESADRLATIVAQYLKDIDDTAALLKDPAPPAMTAARVALRFHQESINLPSIHAPSEIREESIQADKV